MDILEKVLADMPYRFTIHLFRKIAINKYDIALSFLKSTETKEFLLSNCIQTNMFNYKKIVNEILEESEIQKAIKLLQSTNCYKILKRVDEWNEI